MDRRRPFIDGYENGQRQLQGRIGAYHITCALAELIDTAEADVAEGSRVVGR